MKSSFCWASAGAVSDASAAAMTNLRMEPPRVGFSRWYHRRNHLVNMKASQIPAEILALLRRGSVIPAHPLALDAHRKLDERRQRALARYYLDAGSGGLAVGVHATQFAIREAGLYEPVLKIAMEEARSWAKRPVLMIAGLSGKTAAAVKEAKTAR